MNVNKKFDRFRQWGKEKMGAEARTDTTEEFKNLEQEMDLRQDGMEKLHSSMNTYVKSLTKRSEGAAKDKATPVGHMGATMTKHGAEFEDGNKFGECLMVFGQANERIARTQETYASNASSSWLECLERSLVQMKEYQNARKRLESRRLAYDTSLSKMQKTKREDFRVEEELRSQKAKFEESQEDVARRMQDIIEAENDNAMELHTFLEAEITYYDRCREILLQLKRDWPMSEQTHTTHRRGSAPRSRSNTLNKTAAAHTIDEDELAPPSLPIRPSSRASSTSSRHEFPQSFEPPTRTPMNRAISSELTSSRPPMARSATDTGFPTRPSQLRPSMATRRGTNDVYHDYHAADDLSSSPDHHYDTEPRSSSPATSYGTNVSRKSSYVNLANSAAAASNMMKKAPPPPPPSRSTKPPPPPPPMKRSALSATTVV